MKKQSKGFTLVELLAVIVILALIMIIAIPALLKTTNNAKKESFFLYAQSLQSKSISQYTQDLENNKENTNCAVYDVSKDLGISDTGKFEGWVKVNRIPNNSGKNNVYVQLSDTNDLQYVKYCTAKGTTCNPNVSYFVEEGTKKVTISKALKEGYVLCANYQYVSNNKLVTKAKVCKKYSDGSSIVDSYRYEVRMTIKDQDYAVENVLFSEEMSKNKFYDAIAKFKKDHKDRKTDKLAIYAPSCTGTNDGVKGTTTTQSTIVTTSKTSGKETSKVTKTTTTTKGNAVVDTTTTTTKGNQVVDRTTTTKKGNTVVTTTTTTKKGTEVVTTTTTTKASGTEEVTKKTTTTKGTTIVSDPANTTTSRDTTHDTTTTTRPIDNSLLLQNLNVNGYNEYIGFNKLKYNYELVVPNSVTSLNINATPMSDITTVTVTGNDNLREGLNTIVVTLFNTETGKQAYYRIIVRRVKKGEEAVNTTKKPQDPNYNPEDGKPDPTLEESNAALKHLMVSGYVIDFSPTVYDYTLETFGEKELTVVYKAASDKAIVTVSGDKDTKDGSQIVVFVQSQNGFYSKSYTINIVHKKEESKSTKTLKTVAAGLGVVLAIALGAIAINKRKGVKITDETKPEDNRFNNNSGSTN